jgi:3-keto-5-aminohexanoate cleavage enzyme
MIGTKVTVRLRMSAHDAHYAGDLVDGARMLGLFGDIATELLIRLDGDEGLFRAYESVEFLAPVRAGDYIEATGEITKIGATSRVMRFEARKVITNCHGEGLAVSAAHVLQESVLVCRAVGTCVTPAAQQRFSAAREAFGDIVLTAAIVGAELTRAQTPYLPLTPREIADESARCREAGASVIHLHVRNDDGSNTQSKERFAETIEHIRKKTDCIIQVSTGGAVGMSIDERVGPLACNPEMATLNCGSLNFGDDVFINTRSQIQSIAQRLKSAGAVAELECYEVGHVEEALALAEKGILSAPLHFQFVLGVSGGIGAREANVRHMVSLLPKEATWAVAAVGRHQKPMTELAMRLGGHARVGLEDNIYLDKGVLSEGSAPLVARAAAYACSIGRIPVEPARARALLLTSGAP